jgi:L-amino acid N-acyltransferase YncA
MQSAFFLPPFPVQSAQECGTVQVPTICGEKEKPKNAGSITRMPAERRSFMNSIQDMPYKITLCEVKEEDAAALLEIYAPYVRETAITFEYDVPTEEEFRERIRRVKQKYPYLAAVADGTIVGYAYAGPFIPRAAYDRSAEMSIYLRMDRKRLGIGSLLYDEMEKRLRAQGICNLYACIGVPSGGADEYLSFDSMHFHEARGYALAGTFHKCGYKFGRWYDMIWMEKLIAAHD